MESERRCPACRFAPQPQSLRGLGLFAFFRAISNVNSLAKPLTLSHLPSVTMPTPEQNGACGV